MIIHVDTQNPIPIYRQIEDQIILGIASGEYIEGDIMPSIRALSVELRINPNTIIRAYRELEMTGFIESRHGSGFFVRFGSSEPARIEYRKRVLKSVRKEMKRALLVGVDSAELQQIMDEEISERGKI